MQKRFHIRFGARRTTVSVDTILFELMALKLGVQPDDGAAHAAVRDWLQDKLVSSLGGQAVRNSASQWARVYLVEAIADASLARRRDDWLLGEG